LHKGGDAIKNKWRVRQDQLEEKELGIEGKGGGLSDSKEK